MHSSSHSCSERRSRSSCSRRSPACSARRSSCAIWRSTRTAWAPRRSRPRRRRRRRASPPCSARPRSPCGSRSASTGSRATPGWPSMPRPPCCWSRRSRSAWSSPATSSTRARGVDQLLFGSLLAVGNDELIATATVLALAAAPRRHACAAPGSPVDSRRPRVAPWACPSRIADWVLVALIAVAVVARARRDRSAFGRRDPRDPRRDRSPVRHSVRRPRDRRRGDRARRGLRRACSSPTSSTSRPARRSRPSAASSSRCGAFGLEPSRVEQPRRGRELEAAAARHRARAAATRPALGDLEVDFAAAAGEIVAVLGPNGGGKTTLFRALLGELPDAGARSRPTAHVAYVPQTERARLDYPVSALDVALMGTYSSVPWYRPVGREERDRARSALVRVGLAAQESATVRSALGRSAPAGADRPALAQHASSSCSTSRSAASTRHRPSGCSSVLDELRREGRGCWSPPTTSPRPAASTASSASTAPRSPSARRPRRSSPRRCRPPTAPSSSSSTAASRGRGRRPPRALTAMLDALTDPFSGSIGTHALIAVVLLAITCGPLGVWIRALPPELRRRVDRPRGTAGPGDRVARRHPLVLGAGAGLLVAAAAGRGRRAPARSRRRHRGRRHRSPRCSGSARCWPSPPTFPRALASCSSATRSASPTATWSRSAALAVVVLAALAGLHRPLALAGFDAQSARSLGVGPGPVEGALLGLLALTTLVAIQTLGNLLVVAALDRPRRRGASPRAWPAAGRSRRGIARPRRRDRLVASTPATTSTSRLGAAIALADVRGLLPDAAVHPRVRRAPGTGTLAG